MGHVPAGHCLRRHRPGSPADHPAFLAQDGGQAPIKISAKALGSVAVGVLGALLLGVGMCMVMVFGKMAVGIVIGLVGIVVLLMLIPLIKGIHD